MNSIPPRPVLVPHKVPVPEQQPQYPQQTEQPQDKDKKVVTVLIVTVILALLLLLLLLLLFLNRPSQSTGTANASGQQTESSGNGLGAAGNIGTEINSGNLDADHTDTSIQSQNQTDIAEGQQNVAENDPDTTADAAEQETERENGHNQQNESVAAQISDVTRSKETNDKTEGERLAANLNNREDDQKNDQRSFNGDRFNSLQKHDATLQVFGTSGRGSSFVFVFDHSGSMTGKRLNSVKAELLQCLESLNQNHLLNIIFFDDKYISWHKGLTSATKKNKQHAIHFIETVSPGGGTKPLPALLQAIKSKPNVIFFLTDGEFAMDLDDICPQAGKTKINVIQFGSSESPSPLLQNLAKRTNGDYRYINVELLDKL